MCGDRVVWAKVLSCASFVKGLQYLKKLGFFWIRGNNLVEDHQSMQKRACMRKILFLAANPIDTTRLRVDQEARDVREALKRSMYRDKFSIETCWAVNDITIRRELLELEPHILHFSGHGSGVEGLYFEDEMGRAKLISGEALANLFKLFPNIECVVLNGCSSKEQAEAISQSIPYVIGMSQSITDKAAIKFAVGFYDGLGAGKSFDDAYELSRVAIQTAGLPEYLTPTLIKRPDIEKEKTELSSSPSSMKSRSLEVFISYAQDSQEDKRLCTQLEKSLSVLQKDGVINTWHTGKIMAGTIWKHEIDERLKSANIVLLLISPDFLSSNDEFNDLLQRHRQGKSIVIPILLRSSDWEATLLNELVPLPTNRRPISRWADKDEAFLNVTKGIRERIQNT